VDCYKRNQQETKQKKTPFEGFLTFSILIFSIAFLES
jgi:hypothetical protein